MTRIVFVNRYGPPDESATAALLHELGGALAAAGHDVHIVCSGLDHRGGRAGPPPDTNYRVRQVWSTGFGRQNLFGRLLDSLSFLAAAAWRLWRTLRPGDIAVLKSDPPLLGVCLGPLARRRSARVLHWQQDLFPEAAVAAGVLDPRGAIARALMRLRDRELARAEAVAVPGEDLARRLLARGILPARMHVLPNWADGASLGAVPHAANRLRDDWGLQGECVIGYCGNLGRAHEFETLIGAAEVLRDERGLRFLIVGDGAQQERVHREIARRRLDNVSLRPFQPRVRLSELLSACDVHLVTQAPAFAGCVVPSKFYAIAAVSRPVIFVGPVDGEVARVLAEEGCGATVAPGDVASLCGCLRLWAGDPGLRDGLGRAARTALEKKYGLPIAVRRWEGLIAAVGRG